MGKINIRSAVCGSGCWGAPFSEGSIAGPWGCSLGSGGTGSACGGAKAARAGSRRGLTSGQLRKVCGAVVRHGVRCRPPTVTRVLPPPGSRTGQAGANGWGWGRLTVRGNL